MKRFLATVFAVLLAAPLGKAAVPANPSATWQTQEITTDLQSLYSEGLITNETYASIISSGRNRNGHRYWKVKINGQTFRITAWSAVKCVVLSAGAIAGCTTTTGPLAFLCAATAGLTVIRACGLERFVE